MDYFREYQELVDIETIILAIGFTATGYILRDFPCLYACFCPVHLIIVGIIILCVGIYGIYLCHIK